MHSPSLSVHLVGVADSDRARAVLAANESLGRGGVVRQSPNLAAAILAPMAGPEVIVLLEPCAEDFDTVLAALDPRGLPRWAVVPCSHEDAQRPDFASADWAVPMLARSIGSAGAMLALRRDNARLRGDLNTVGRRLAHDLRTPLNSISTANAVLAESRSVGDSVPTLHESIAAAVEEAGSLIERVGLVLLASARPVVLQPVEMEEPVWSARQRLDGPLHSAGAIITAPEQWPVVDGVPFLLETVWVNLLANSLRHAGAAPRIELGWSRSEAGTRFWLRDSGPGVPVAKRRHLFYPIDRLNELSAPRGYGLPIVQRLIELQGGTVGYDADAGAGGTFFFTLP